MNDSTFVLPNALLFEEVECRIARGESVSIPFAGISMEPFLHDRRVSIELSPLSRLIHPHDIVLFRSRQGHILHRVVRIEGEQVVTRGDACQSEEISNLSDVVARLTAVQWPSGKRMREGSFEWNLRSSYSVMYGRLRTGLVAHLDSTLRRRLSVVYFVLLAAVMWLPLNGLGIALDSFVLGIRLDHVVHASLFLPCAFFLMDSKFRGVSIWFVALLVSCATEFGQLLLPYRGFDINDLVANWMGVTLGWLPLCRYRRGKKR